MEKIKKYYDEFQEELKNHKKITKDDLKSLTDEEIENELKKIKRTLKFTNPPLSYVEHIIWIMSFVEETLNRKGFYKDRNLEIFSDIFSILHTEISTKGTDLNRALKFYRIEYNHSMEEKINSPLSNLGLSLAKTLIQHKTVNFATNLSSSSDAFDGK